MWFYPDKFIILLEWRNIPLSIQELKYTQARWQLWFHSFIHICQVIPLDFSETPSKVL